MNKGKGDLQWSSWIFLCQWNLKFFILPLQKITEMVPELEPSIIEQIRQLQAPSQYRVYPFMAVDRILRPLQEARRMEFPITSHQSETVNFSIQVGKG